MTASPYARILLVPGLLLTCTAAAHEADGSAWIVVRDDKTFSTHGDIDDLKRARKQFPDTSRRRWGRNRNALAGKSSARSSR